MKAKNNRSLFSRIILFILVMMVTGPLLMSYAAVIINPAKFWLITVFGVLYIPILIVALVLLVIAVIRRSRLATWLLVILLPAVFLTGRYVRFKGGDEVEGPVKVVSYNLGLFANGDKKAVKDSRLSVAESSFEYIRSLDADIICLQEFYIPNSYDPESYLRSHFPGYRADYYMLTGSNGHAGNVTLSRLPVRGKGKVPFDRSTNMAIYTDVSVNDTLILRVYNCHFESYNLSPDEVIRSLAEEKDMESTGAKMRKAITRRPDQIAEVRRSMTESPFRSMVVGDFNDTPLSYTYQILRQTRKDAFIEAGKGISFTYKRFRPFLRIDYILFPKDLEAATFSSGEASFSDHYPQIATFKVAK